MRHSLLFVAVLITSLAATPASADPRGVGLGVAVGGAYSPTKLQHDTSIEPVGGGFIWGFFVDIPLLDTFYISPAAMLYELDSGQGRLPVTDIDLNFKFIVPIDALQIGVGLTAGLSNAEQTYEAHFGVLGYLGYNLVSNFDVFALVQYKRLVREGPEIDYLHAFAGGMFRF